VKFENCKLVWVCDSKARKGNFRFTKDSNEVINDPEINTIFVCTPNCHIKDLVVKSLDAGKHVFAEKPPGVNVAEVEEIIAAEKRNPGLKLKFGFNHRMHDSVIEMKKQIDSGKFGEILWLRGRYGKSVDENFKHTWRAKSELAGGGILLDQGIHMLDLFLMFVDDFEEVKSFVSDLYWNLDIEDNVFAIFRNKKGQVASLHSTMTQWRHLFSLEIFLERGYMVLNGILSSTMSYGHEDLSIAENRTPPPQAAHSREERMTYQVDTSWEKEMAEFVNAVEEGSPVKIGTSRDALKLMRVIEKVYKNGKS
jgi:predicted dehydrogenase